MNLFIFKDGKTIVTESNQPINIPLENLVVCCTNPQFGQVMRFDGRMWTNSWDFGVEHLEMLKTFELTSDLGDITLDPEFDPLFSDGSKAYGYQGMYAGGAEAEYKFTLTAVPYSSDATLTLRYCIDDGEWTSFDSADELDLSASVSSGSVITFEATVSHFSFSTPTKYRLSVAVG